ncbi:MAG: hypothetical protein CMH25_04005 [Micavibrio sp.]|nr:hypothetical protein [Micavibrio sp.]|tara:strand:- start:182 stop:514 length:333 start_codon:yes stop_codon:yes gene_type:complete
MKIILLIGAIISFAIAGVGGLTTFAFLALIIWYVLTERGLLFIRSYLYLRALRDTDDEKQSNKIANRVNIFSSREHLNDAVSYANMHSDGKQLPVIKAAKKYGYKARGII